MIKYKTFCVNCGGETRHHKGSIKPVDYFKDIKDLHRKDKRGKK